MSIAALAAIAAVLIPIVLLLSFAGCGVTLTAPEYPDEEGPKVEDPPTLPPIPAPPDAPDKYHNLVLTGTELISYWKLDEPAGASQAVDSAPLPKNPGIYADPHATAAGVLQLGPDADDTAPVFDGVASLVEVAHETLMNPVSNTNFSVEAWIRPTPGAAGRQVVVGSYRVDTTGKIDRGFVLEIEGGAAPKARARTAPNGLAEAPLPPSVDGWFHIAATYQASAKTLRLYVNVPDNLQPRATDTTASYVANRRVAATDVAPPLRIGAGQKEPLAAGTPAALFFNGRIDNVALYRGLLTAAEIKSHFDAARKA